MTNKGLISARQTGFRIHRGIRAGFVEQILPGLAGGVLSSLTFYPLEMYETTLQARNATTSRESASQHTAMRPRTPYRVRPLSEIPDQACLPDTGRARGVANLEAQQYQSQMELTTFFKGADMALASAVFGFSAFFTTLAIADTVFPSSAVHIVLAKNILAATAGQLANSPFQLLKTIIVVSGSSTLEAARSVTQQGQELQRLWTGVRANLLGVLTVACQFTIFRSMLCQVGGSAASPLEAGAVGAFACLMASVLTFPSVSLKTAVMAQQSVSNEPTVAHPACNIAKAAIDLYQKGALYAGITPFLLRSVPPTGLLFAIQRGLELAQ